MVVTSSKTSACELVISQTYAGVTRTEDCGQHRKDLDLRCGVVHRAVKAGFTSASGGISVFLSQSHALLPRLTPPPPPPPAASATATSLLSFT